jgi:hypothetical protein
VHSEISKRAVSVTLSECFRLNEELAKCAAFALHSSVAARVRQLYRLLLNVMFTEKKIVIFFFCKTKLIMNSQDYGLA